MKELFLNSIGGVLGILVAQGVISFGQILGWIT